MYSRLSLTRSSPHERHDVVLSRETSLADRSEERQLYLQATNLVNLCSTDATSQETLILKVYDPDSHTSDEEMMARLKEADLESHGYKKEQTTKLVSEPGSAQPVYEKKFLFYKIVDCSRVREIIRELETLIPGKYLIYFFIQELLESKLTQKM